jgi:glycosyltransferase 2 family protein
MTSGWRTLTVYGGLALGLGLLAAFLWRLDFRAVFDVMAHVDGRWLAVAAGMTLVHYALQGLRWQVLLHHVAPKLDFGTVWRGTTILWAFNTILGLRAGTMLRPGVVTLKHEVPYTTVLFSLVAETVCELFGLVVLVLVSLAVLPDDALQSGSLGQARTAGMWAAVGALALLGVVIALSSGRARAAVEGWVAPLPSETVRERILSTFDQLVHGMAAVGDPMRLVLAFALTIGVWGAWTAAIQATLLAFGLDLPFAAAMFIQAALAVAMLVPQAPGFLGTFQAVTLQALALFSAPQAESQAVALVLWVVCFVPISVLGVFDAWSLGIGVGPRGRARAFQDLAEGAAARVREPQDTPG